MGQTVQPGKRVSLKYKLYREDGTLVHATDEAGEVHMLGSGTLLPALDQALIGHPIGAKLELHLNPDHASDPHLDSGSAQPLPRVALPADEPVYVGASLEAETPDGQPQLLYVTRVEEREVFVSAQHPFAGLRLDVVAEIVAIDDPAESAPH